MIRQLPDMPSSTLHEVVQRTPAIQKNKLTIISEALIKKNADIFETGYQ